jgi:hypothetical protein
VLAIVEHARHLPAVGHRSGFPARDQLLRQRAQLLGLGQRGDDALVDDQRGELVAEHGEPVRRGPPELAASLRVTHGFLSRSAAGRGCAAPAAS